jgi:hypothetical protein
VGDDTGPDLETTMTPRTFWNLVDQTADRMAQDNRRAAQAAIAAGGREVSRGRYYEGGPVVVTVECPEEWWRVNGKEIREIRYTE